MRKRNYRHAEERIRKLVEYSDWQRLEAEMEWEACIDAERFLRGNMPSNTQIKCNVNCVKGMNLMLIVKKIVISGRF